MSTNNRLDKINSELTKGLQSIISYELKDPRISGMVSVIKCEATPDLKHAKVNLSVFAKTDEEKQATFVAVNNSKNFIRHMLKTYVDLRCIPDLHFINDDSIDASMRINQILKDLNA